MNNLTQREKVLIYMIVGIVPVLVLFFGFNWFMGRLQAKRNELDVVSRKLTAIELRATQAMAKSELKNLYKQRSLDAQENVAQGEYREWLRNLAENEIKFGGAPKVQSKGNNDYKSDFGKKDVIYRQLSFQLDCQGTYKQLVEFLYRFYEKNYIHRITRLDLNLVKGKRNEGRVTYDRNKFAIKVQIQVLSLVDADDIRSPMLVENSQLFYQDELNDKIIHDLEDYNAIVLRRNLFGFPNNAPDFGSRKKEFDFEEGDRVSVRLSADDEDDDDLEFLLESTDGKVTSDQIEQSRAGSFKLDIKELGTYEFKASVTDKNYYPKTDDMLVVVNIEEKEPEEPKKDPPPKPKFDPLKFTFLEAIVRNFEGTPICWINVRPYGKMHRVGAGATFEVGRTAIEIVKINRRNAVISIDGDQYLFQVNDALGKPQGEVLASTRSAKPETEDKTAKTLEQETAEPKTIDVNVKNPSASAQKDDKDSNDKDSDTEASKQPSEESTPEAETKDKSTEESPKKDVSPSASEQGKAITAKSGSSTE